MRRIASRKSSFLLFKQTFSHDFALGFPQGSQLRSSAREQEKNFVFVREKEEDFREASQCLALASARRSPDAGFKRREEWNNH